MRAGVTYVQRLAAQRTRVSQGRTRRLLPTLTNTISHTRERPWLANEYSVVVSQDDSTITLSRSRAKPHLPATKTIFGGAEQERYAALIPIDWADQRRATAAPVQRRRGGAPGALRC